MSTNLSGNTLTLGGTSLNEETLKALKSYYYVPDNCKAGDTVILDGIECLCVATGVTIQGSNLTRIAVDKNYDLGYYQKYVGIPRKTSSTSIIIDQIRRWAWGGYGTALGNTYQEVGYGLQNTIRCLANKVVYTYGTGARESSFYYPLVWKGVNDFISSHSNKWFLPSLQELKQLVRPYRSSLSYDTDTGGTSNSYYMSSSEQQQSNYFVLDFEYDKSASFKKDDNSAVRLCRAF